MDELRLTLLGGIEVMQAGKRVKGFVSQKALALFCYFAVTSRTHPRSLLQSLLWGDTPQEDAMNSLRNVLSNLRKLAGDHLSTTRQTAAFNPDAPYWLDVEQFLTAAQGRALQDGRLSPPKLQALTTAVSLYTGEFMAGFSLAEAPAFEEWLLAQRERLRLLYLQTLHNLVIHHASAGQIEQAVEMNGRLLTTEPWREESHRQQMALLARAGRWSEALAHYHACRDLLRQELDVSPLPEITALYERIKTARNQPRHNLPAPNYPLLGREKELAELAASLRRPDCRLLTLTGPGGIGKTRLAQALAAQLADAFLNGIRYLALATVPDPSFLDTAVAIALGLSLQPQPSPRQQLLNHLQPLEQLLVIDNFDHLLDGVDELAQILAQTPDIKLLVTSRERLNLQAEWLYPLTGLSFPQADAATEAIPGFPAVQLFADQARRARYDFTLVGQEAAVAKICRLLEGVPLGIELAAAQTTALTPVQIETNLRYNLDALAVSWRDRPERHHTLRAVFNQSWEGLSPNEQAVFRRLAVFRGGFTQVAGTAVANLTPSILTTLMAKSFLHTSADPNRYEIHEILRQYAADELAADPAVEAETNLAYVRYFAGELATQENRFTTALDEVMGRLRPDADNLRYAWQTAVARADWNNLAAMMGSLHRFYEAQPWYQEGSNLLQQTLAALEPVTAKHQAVYARLQTHAAGLLFRLGQINEGKQLAKQSLQILRTQPDSNGLALAMNTVGIFQIHSGEFLVAEATLRACINLYRQLANRAELVRPLANLGSACSRQGKYAEGLAALEEGLSVCREIGDRRGEALFLNNIAAGYLMQDQPEAARPYLEACLPICDEIGFDQVKQVALYNLGEICLNQNELTQAIAVCQASAESARRLNSRLNLARALKQLGVAQTRLGTFAAAWGSLKEGLEAAESTNGLPTLVDVLDGIATYFLALDREQEAKELLQLLATHPAAESQYRDRAQGWLTASGMLNFTSRPLEEVVHWLLYSYDGEK